ncbi:unknown [Eubacterium sp. CAG:786]|nr:unknown [Eubacterium sp. CAG:786]
MLASRMTAPERSLPRDFIIESPSFSVSSSSKTSRLRASVYSSRLCGKCICLTACSRVRSPMRRTSPSGSVSGSFTTVSAVFTFAETMLFVSPAVSGYFGIRPFSLVSTNSGEPICILTMSPFILP